MIFENLLYHGLEPVWRWKHCQVKLDVVMGKIMAVGLGRPTL